MDSYVLCGMQFGDEGKGTFVDYLAHEKDIDCVVRYNGGSQASHTVITPSGSLHKFSHLGSGMFLEKCHTYLTENMVINLDNLMVELEVFSDKTGISIQNLINRIHIHENCFIVTPYHKLINKLRELSKGDNRRGTVGTGVSEVKYLLSEPKLFPYDQPLGLQVKDVYNTYTNNPIIGRIEALQDYVFTFYQNNKEVIWQNVPEEIKEGLSKEIEFLLEPNGYYKIAAGYINNFKYAPQKFNLKKCIYATYESSFRENCKSVIYEGSQGLLIDGTYGIKPNTTFLDTTNHFAMNISYCNDNITKIGIAKAFTSRHGLGVFPTESSDVSSRICDKNQSQSYWNGKIRFGWFDAVLFRYAQSINKVDELYLSSIDKLDEFDEIKVCNEYVYYGIVDKKFEKLFKYNKTTYGDILVTDIKKGNEEDIGNYLKYCEPIYIRIKGWRADTTKISNKSQLPKKCLEYIELLEQLTNVPITTISVGPTRENKLALTTERS